MRGDADEARARTAQLAEEFAARWVKEAADGDHYRLTFDKPGTWSQKYNLVWDRLLGLQPVPAEEVRRKEIAITARSRTSTACRSTRAERYTKLDWIALDGDARRRPTPFEDFVERILRYVDETPNRVPFSDLYYTDNGRKMGFQARSVVGSLFIGLLIKA